MIVISFVSAFSGFVLLSLAMKRHFKQVWPDGKLNQTKVFVFRAIGAGLLILSCLLCVNNEGFGIGLVLWFGILTFSALLQSMILTYQPHNIAKRLLAL